MEKLKKKNQGFKKERNNGTRWDRENIGWMDGWIERTRLVYRDILVDHPTAAVFKFKFQINWDFLKYKLYIPYCLDTLLVQLYSATHIISWKCWVYSSYTIIDVYPINPPKGFCVRFGNLLQMTECPTSKSKRAGRALCRIRPIYRARLLHIRWFRKWKDVWAVLFITLGNTS